MDRHAAHPVVVSDVSVEFVGKRKRQFEALKGVSFTIERGELLGVIGESGSGKSALAKVVGAVTRSGHDTWPVVTHGSLTVLGEELRRVHDRKLESLRLHIGYLPQDAATRLIPHLNVAENVAEPILSRDRHFNRRELGQRIAIMLDAVHLPLSTMTKAPWELSSGQQQRVAIARSLILEPAIWVADEPTTGIDITVRDTVAELIARLRAEREFSALIISHDLSVSSQLTSKVAVLYKGELVGYGALDDVLANPIHPYVKGLALSRAQATPRPRSRH